MPQQVCDSGSLFLKWGSVLHSFKDRSVVSLTFNSCAGSEVKDVS